MTNQPFPELVTALTATTDHELRLELAEAIKGACWALSRWAAEVTFRDRVLTWATQMVVFVADHDFDDGRVGDRIKYDLWDHCFDVKDFDVAIERIETELKKRVSLWGANCAWEMIERRQTDWVYKGNMVAYLQFGDAQDKPVFLNNEH